MRVVDTLSAQTIQTDNPHGLVSENGSFCLLASQQSTSAWEGLYFLDRNDTTAHKVLHAITHNQEITEFDVGLNAVIRKSDSLKESFHFHNEVFVYCANANAQTTIQLDFDIREANDYSTQNRFHTIEQLDECLYKVDGKDASYIIATTKPLNIADHWKAINTTYDQRRGGSEQWWVHQRFQIHLDADISIAIGSDIQTVQAALHSEPDMSVSKSHDPLLVRAQHALDELTVDTSLGTGILAGYPWFTQVWTRDEAIALGAHIQQGHTDIASEILLRQISRIDEHGRISNRTPGSELGSADGVGWVFTRLHELFTQYPESLNDNQWRYCYEQLCVSLDRLFEHHYENGLITNDPKETWMDTNGSTDDVREGACIEIQALTLRILACARDLAHKFHENPSWWQNKLDILKSNTRNAFFQSNRLYDRASDPTQRPNAFLAAYVYEDLLSHDEWRRVFLNLLEALWLDWGALSTIDINHHLFKELHSGMMDDSYHRGDTWYWVNLVAAVVLHKHSEEFQSYARELVDAAKTDMQKLGVIGHLSEISNAKFQEAFGCWSQAWSASMFIEYQLLVDSH